MEKLIELNETNNIVNDIDISNKNKLDAGLVKNSKDFGDVIGDVLDKGAAYVIKSMPINQHIKDILIDVKNSLKTKDFTNVLKTAVNSSIREGLEILSLPKTIINDFSKIKDIALTGGLRYGVNAALDLVSKKFKDGNIYYSYISEFFENTKNFVFSNKFNMQIGDTISKNFDKTKSFKDLCDKWYKAYGELDIENMNEIAKSLNYKKKHLKINQECMTQNEIIQNMTELINVKKDKLSENQLQICATL